MQIQAAAAALDRSCSPMRAMGGTPFRVIAERTSLPSQSPSRFHTDPLSKSLSCDASYSSRHRSRSKSCLGVSSREGHIHTDRATSSHYRFSSPVMQSPHASFPLAVSKTRAMSAFGRRNDSSVEKRVVLRAAIVGGSPQTRGVHHRRSCSDSVVKTVVPGMSARFPKNFGDQEWEGLRKTEGVARASGRRTQVVCEGERITTMGALEVVSGPEGRVKRTRRASPAQRQVAQPAQQHRNPLAPELMDEVEVVKWGDTLTGLSRRHSCDVADWIPRNSERIKDVNRIYAGDILRIPAVKRNSASSRSEKGGGGVVYASVRSQNQGTHDHRAASSPARAASAPPAGVQWQPAQAGKGAVELGSAGATWLKKATSANGPAGKSLQGFLSAADAARKLNEQRLHAPELHAFRSASSGRTPTFHSILQPVQIGRSQSRLAYDSTASDLVWNPLPKRRADKQGGRRHGGIQSPSEWFQQAGSNGVRWVKRVVVTTNDDASEADAPVAAKVVANRFKSGVSSMTESLVNRTSVAVTRIGERLPPPFEGPRGVAVVASGAALLFAAIIAASQERQEAWRETQPAFRTRGDVRTPGATSPTGQSPSPRFGRQIRAKFPGLYQPKAGKAAAPDSPPPYAPRVASASNAVATSQRPISPPKLTGKKSAAPVSSPPHVVTNPVLSFPVTRQPLSKSSNAKNASVRRVEAPPSLPAITPKGPKQSKHQQTKGANSVVSPPSTMLPKSPAEVASSGSAKSAVAPARFTSPPAAASRPRRSLAAFLRSRKPGPDLAAPGSSSSPQHDSKPVALAQPLSARWRLPQLLASAMKLTKTQKDKKESPKADSGTPQAAGPATTLTVSRPRQGLEAMGLGRLGRVVRAGQEIPSAEAGIVEATEETESVGLVMTKRGGASAVATASASAVARATAVAVAEVCVEFEVEDWVYMDEEESKETSSSSSSAAATPGAAPAHGAAAVLHLAGNSSDSHQSFDGLAAALGSPAPFFDHVSRDPSSLSSRFSPDGRQHAASSSSRPLEMRQVSPLALSQGEVDVQLAERPMQQLGVPEFLSVPAPAADVVEGADVAAAAADMATSPDVVAAADVAAEAGAEVVVEGGRRKVKVMRKMTERVTAVASATATALANATATAVAGVPLGEEGRSQEDARMPTGVVESSSALYRGKLEVVDVDSAIVPKVDERREKFVRSLQAATPAFAVGAGAMASIAGVDAGLEMVGFAAMAGFVFSDVLWDDSRRQLMKNIESITDHKRLGAFLRQRGIINDDNK